MINFITLDILIQDILNLARGGIVTQSEPISKIQIEFWIHQYRSLLLKREWDKKKYISSDWMQTLQGLELIEVDESEGTTITTDYKTVRTLIKIPTTVTYNWGPGILYVGTITGQEIQLMPESRSRWQKHRKYTNNDRVAYMKNGYIYIENDKELRYLDIKGVFEIPTEVSHTSNLNEILTDATAASQYPIPLSMVPVLKEMILKQELNVIVSAYSDTDQDSASDVSPNLTDEVKQK